MRLLPECVLFSSGPLQSVVSLSSSHQLPLRSALTWNDELVSLPSPHQSQEHRDLRWHMHPWLESCCLAWGCSLLQKCVSGRSWFCILEWWNTLNYLLSQPGHQGMYKVWALYFSLIFSYLTYSVWTCYNIIMSPFLLPLSGLSDHEDRLLVLVT